MSCTDSGRLLCPKLRERLPNYCMRTPAWQGCHAFAAVHNFGSPSYICLVTGETTATRQEEDMTRKTNTLYDRFRRWRRYRDTVRELQGLSTHELNDLGINRVDISRLAREASRI